MTPKDKMIQVVSHKMLVPENTTEDNEYIYGLTESGDLYVLNAEEKWEFVVESPILFIPKDETNTSTN